MPDYDETKVIKSEIDTDKFSHHTLPIEIRTFIEIPFCNVHKGLDVTVIMMNPSDADTSTSDQSVNKLIDFFAHGNVSLISVGVTGGDFSFLQN